MDKRNFFVLLILLGLYTHHSHAMGEFDSSGLHRMSLSMPSPLVAEDPSSTQASSACTMDPKGLFLQALGQLRSEFRLLRGNVDSILDDSEQEFTRNIEKRNRDEPEARTTEEPIQMTALSSVDQEIPGALEQRILENTRIDIRQKILGCEDQLVNEVMKSCEVIIRRQMGIIQNLQKRLAVARHKHTLAILEGERAQYFGGIITRQEGIINCLAKQLEESRCAQLGASRDSGG